MKINVAKSFLPPQEEYTARIKNIWADHWLTNHGPLSLEFEKGLSAYLGVRNLQFITNGTIALQIAYKALELKGEVITTPFSFIATSSSLHWEGCRIVFADIDGGSFNLDPARIENQITDKTSAIVATHVYGNPCEIGALTAIAKKHNLKLIFDAAHCFGVRYRGKSVLEYGHASMLSLHATKLFHSTEGGVLVTEDDSLNAKFWELKNFGFKKEEVILGQGINGKNSEFHAAMGLCNLKYADKILDRYRKNYLHYKELLQGCQGINFQVLNPDADYNYAYFPILLESEKAALLIKSELGKEGIFSRRYFYPALNNVSYLAGQKCEVAESVSCRILCLPMSYYLAEAEVEKIAKTIKFNL